MKNRIFGGLILVLILTVVGAGLYLHRQGGERFREEILLPAPPPVTRPEPAPVVIYEARPADSAEVVLDSPPSEGSGAVTVQEIPAGPATSAPVVETPATPAPPPARSAPLEARRGMVRGSGVNVRSSPELQYDNANRVAQLARGTRVELLEKKREAGGGPHYWYRVRLPDGRDGWIRDDLIQIEE